VRDQVGATARLIGGFGRETIDPVATQQGCCHELVGDIATLRSNVVDGRNFWLASLPWSWLWCARSPGQPAEVNFWFAK